MVVIVMGVSGAGKTTIGRALASSLGWEFHDGDDLHTEASKLKMHRGIALDDADRAPWLRAIRELIVSMLDGGRNGVVACSALKQSYRDELVVDPGGRRVLIDDAEVALTQREFDLLLFLARHPGQAFTRNSLMDHVWRYSFYTDTSTVTVHVRRLRAKIERDPERPRFLETIWGVGYRFRP